MKKEKSAGVDNIPAELVQAGGENVNHHSANNMQQDLADRRMANLVDPVLITTLPKKGNLQQCQNYGTISLISHRSKVMLKIMLNRLMPRVEKIIAEEQAGFRAGRSTTEQIFNLTIPCDKYLQHQQDLYHVYTGFGMQLCGQP